MLNRSLYNVQCTIKISSGPVQLSGGTDKIHYNKSPFKVICRRFTVNIVKEKDGSTVRDVGIFYLRFAT